MKIFKVLVVALAMASLAVAMPIVGLYSTGEGSTPGNQELNWVMNGDGTPYVTQTGVFPFGTWVANDANSQWISAQSTYAALQSDAGGNYTFSLSFSLGAGDDPATAWMDYGIAADDTIVSVYLNSTEIGGGAPGYAGNAMSYYTANTGFVAGLNEIVITILNSDAVEGNPVGVRFEAGDSDVQSAVPEPATFALVGLVLAALPLVRRRRSS